MKRVSVVVVAAVMLFGAMVGTAAGGSGNNGAGKAPMYVGSQTTNWTCPSGAFPIGETFGFVVMNINAEGTLIGTVSLKGAQPGLTYTVAIVWDAIPSPSGAQTCDDTPILGFLTTDAEGNGNLKFEISGVPPQGQVWVIAVDPADLSGPRLQSPAVNLNYPNSP